MFFFSFSKYYGNSHVQDETKKTIVPVAEKLLCHHVARCLNSTADRNIHFTHSTDSLRLVAPRPCSLSLASSHSQSRLPMLWISTGLASASCFHCSSSSSSSSSHCPIVHSLQQSRTTFLGPSQRLLPSPSFLCRCRHWRSHVARTLVILSSSCLAINLLRHPPSPLQCRCFSLIFDERWVHLFLLLLLLRWGRRRWCCSPSCRYNLVDLVVDLQIDDLTMLRDGSELVILHIQKNTNRHNFVGEDWWAWP